MPSFGLVILYVENPPASAAFYAELLGHTPIEVSPTFAMLPLTDAVSLGLWSRHTVAPTAAAAGGGGELAFTFREIDAVHADWAARGLTIAQTPTDMEFGRTFVALDPDGHRLRVFAPAEQEALRATSAPGSGLT